MNTLHLLYLSLLGCANAIKSNVLINEMYSLGDSITDTGEYFRLANETISIERDYPTKRFTDAYTWVEYLQEELKVKNFHSYAVARATSDTNIYRAYVENNNRTIPGCVQQAQQLNKNLASEYGNPKNTLVTIAFFGNDFFYPNIDIQQSIYNIKNCIGIVAESSKVGHIVIPITSGAKHFPYLDTNPDFKAKLAFASDIIDQGWANLLKNFKSKYPNIKFYGLDYDKIISDLAQNFENPREPCLNMAAFETTEVMKKCPNPESHLFYDKIHPSSVVHKKMAHISFELLNSSSDKTPTSIESQTDDLSEDSIKTISKTEKENSNHSQISEQYQRPNSNKNSRKPRSLNNERPSFVSKETLFALLSKFK